MNQAKLSQVLLDQSHRSMADSNTCIYIDSQEKSAAHYSIVQAMLQYKMDEHSMIQPGELINSSIAEDVPHFSERGADYSSKMHDNDNIRYSDQKPNQRMSHVYPSYMSENQVKIDHEKFQMVEHTYTVQQIEQIFNTNLNQGLSEEEASLRLNHYGMNKIESKRASVPWEEIINKFTVALSFAILFSFIGYVVDEREHIPFLIECGILITIFLITHVLTYAAYSKKKKLLNEFNEIISTDEVNVIRNGVKQQISSTSLVKGDLIELNSFTKIPADCRIVESQQLSVDNFIFTGESQPLLLESEESNHKSIFEARNVAFLGVGIVFGQGKAIVINTGEQTMLGKLIKKIEVPQINSSIDNQVKKLINITFWIIIGFVLLTIIGWFVWEFKAGKYDFTFLINTIIVIILSNLPFTMMLILSYSKRRIAKQLSDQKIILTDINAIENLTQISLLLVNKESLLLEQQRPKKIILENKVYGIHQINNQQNMINCIYYCLHRKKQDFMMNDRQSIQNILEQFIRHYPIDDYNVIKQRQFTAMERYSLTIVQNVQNKSQYTVYMMGAPEVISQKLFLKNSFEEIEYIETHKKMAKKGYSLISCASLTLNLDENYKFNVDNTNEFNFYFKNLTNLGTLALKISISPVIKTALQKLQLSGIRVVLMTGDFPETAHFIAQETNLVANPLLVAGDDFDNPPPENDQPISEETDEESINTKLCTQLNTIYARINPAQKLMVIQAYQKLGYKVGLIGFDTIDSPALRKCDVSFSFSRSDELAKHSSNVILIGENQQDLEQILRSVHQGRRFTDNLIKQIKLCISNKFGQFIPILLMLFLGFPLPLTSFGIIYITIVLDILVASIVDEKEELDVVIREPSKVKIFQKLQHFLRWILTHGCLAASSGMMSYLVAMQYFGFHNKSLPFIIYKEGYSSQIPDSEEYYAYNSSDQYLGNQNLASEPIKFNPFITYQFYKHFHHATFDFRNVIVKFIDGNWTTNFDTSNSDLCKSNSSELCFSYLSLDMAQLGFIYGFIIWGWFHVFLGRTRILSFRYQNFNKRLMLTYIISLLIILVVYLPYMIFYFPDKDLNFFGVIGIPSIPMLLIYLFSSEITAKRNLRKLK